MTLGDMTIVLLAGVGAVRAGQGLRTYIKYRGTRLLTCPETKALAATRIDALHAALAEALYGNSLRLSACSRWPDRRDCGQECLRDIERSPAAGLVRTLASEWYAGKRCVFCRTPLSGGGSFDHPAGLLGPDGQTHLWSDVPAEHLPEMLRRSHAVCWNCHVAERFRRQHPELVIDADPALPISTRDRQIMH